MIIKKTTSITQSLVAIVAAIVLTSNVQAESAYNIEIGDQNYSHQYGIDGKIIHVGDMRLDLSFELEAGANPQHKAVEASKEMNRAAVFYGNIVDVKDSYDMSHIYTW